MEKHKDQLNQTDAFQRKSDHIDLAVKSRTSSSNIDTRFYYEPFLSGHPKKSDKMPVNFLGKKFDFPIWISSMTGGTEKAKDININLAKIAGKYKLGMGLGSCRSLLNSNKYIEDFNVRKHIGDQPLYANLGIAQLEELVADHSLNKIKEMLKSLEADGLIIHVNPIQEFIQPEGDIILKRPIDSIAEVLEKLDTKIIVKEVGQGFGPDSLRTLMQMPLEAIEFAAFGGTNFATLELSRTSEMPRAQFKSLSFVGHTTDEMIQMLNILKVELNSKVLCQQYIVSGGISNFLDGYYSIKKTNFDTVYGMASGFLKYALKSYECLEHHVEKHIDGLKMANAYLIPI